MSTWFCGVYLEYYIYIMFVSMAVAEASVFVQIMGTSLKKTAGQGHFGHFWSLRLILRSGYGDGFPICYE